LKHSPQQVELSIRDGRGYDHAALEAFTPLEFAGIEIGYQLAPARFHAGHFFEPYGSDGVIQDEQ
jgi:hypothetical protein